MGSIHRIWIVLALIASAIHSGNAQNMIPNGDFEVNCGAAIYPHSCETFSATCVLGWQRSHGTPYLDYDDGVVGPTAVIMGSRLYPSGLESEGIFCNLNTPTDPQRRYLICFRYRTKGTAGSFLVGLANGIVPTGPAACGETPPSPSPTHVPYTMTVAASADYGPWQTAAFYASPLQVYNQLYIYPSGTTAEAFWLEVDGFEMLDCASALEFTPGSLPAPSGLFQRNSTIRAFSPGGIGTVTVNPSVPTTFRAAQHVLLEPNFVATPSSTSYFLAEIGTCGCAVALPKTDHADGQSLPDGPRLPHAAGSADLWLYPNPTSGDFTVVAQEPLGHVTVTDLYGKAVLHIPCQKDVVEVRLSLSDLPAGTYLVQGHSRTGQAYLRKLVKQ